MAIKWGKYTVKMKCPNCGFGNDTRIPKGTGVGDFIKTGSFKCDNCGVSGTPEEYKTKWLN